MAFKMKGEYIYGTGLLIFSFCVMFFGYKYSEKMSDESAVKFTRLETDEDEDEEVGHHRSRDNKRRNIKPSVVELSMINNKKRTGE